MTPSLANETRWKHYSSIMSSILFLQEKSETSSVSDDNAAILSDGYNCFATDDEEELLLPAKKKVRTSKSSSKPAPQQITFHPRKTSPKTVAEVTHSLEECVIAKSFAGFFSKAFNSGDINDVERFFRNYCRSDCSVVHQVYAFESLLQGKTLKRKLVDDNKAINPFGNFSSLQFPSLALFYLFMSNFYYMVPDAVLTVSNHRCCYEKETSLYMSSFEWSGTIVTKDTTLLKIDPLTRRITCCNKSTEAQNLQICGNDRCSGEPLIMKGSIAFYVDKSGMIYCLEFFYECLQDYNEDNEEDSSNNPKEISRAASTSSVLPNSTSNFAKLFDDIDFEKEILSSILDETNETFY